MGVGSVRSFLMMAVLLCRVPRAAVARLPDPWSSYHTTDEILSDFSRMAEEHPRWLRWERVEDSLDVATITDSEEPDDDKARLLLVFGEHARELITAELALWLARVLVEEGAEYHAWTESETAFARSLGRCHLARLVTERPRIVTYRAQQQACNLLKTEGRHTPYHLRVDVGVYL